MEISPLELYLMLRLDDIRILFGLSIFLFPIVAVFMIPLSKDTDIVTGDWAIIIRCVGISLVALTLLSIVAVTVIPSTKEMSTLCGVENVAELKYDREVIVRIRE